MANTNNMNNEITDGKDILEMEKRKDILSGKKKIKWVYNPMWNERMIEGEIEEKIAYELGIIKNSGNKTFINDDFLGENFAVYENKIWLIDCSQVLAYNKKKEEKELKEKELKENQLKEENEKAIEKAIEKNKNIFVRSKGYCGDYLISEYATPSGEIITSSFHDAD